MTCKVVIVCLLVTSPGCRKINAPTAQPVPKHDASIQREKKATRHQVVKLSDVAAARFRAVWPAGNPVYLRVAVLNEGPTGFKYDLKFDRELSVQSDYFDDAA